MGEIQATAMPSIAAGDLDEFRQVAAQALEHARGETGTLQYDWFLSASGTECVVRERYADSDAVLAHLAGTGPLLGRLVELAGGVVLEVFGDPSAALREALAPFQPVTRSYFQGK